MRRIAAVVFAASTVLALSAHAPADAKKYKQYANCDAVHKDYKHGIGKKGAKDKVTGKSKPVKNFKVDTGLYNAQKKRKSLDRDKDGIACEKR